MKTPPPGWPRLSAGVFYDEPAKAIDWLCRAFGFEVRLKVEGDDGSIVHSTVAVVTSDGYPTGGTTETGGIPGPAIIGASVPVDLATDGDGNLLRFGSRLRRP